MALPDLSGIARTGAGVVDLAGRVLAGRYRLVAPVGVGASAQVYVADDVQLRRRVAVKVLHPGLAGDPTFLRRFQAEAQAAAALNHPNILAVYDWGRDDAGRASEAVPFLVTEYLDGGSLRSVLDSGTGERCSRQLSLSQALLVGLEVCRGLHYAHNRGFVHRDIKPANLLFGDDRRLRIADFGLARALAEASWTEPEGVVLGTARYVSPEQAAGLPLDTRSDLYSLVLVLVEAVTGEVPHTSDTAVGTLRARLGRSITLDEAVFGPLTPLLEAAGRADPAERSSAAAFGAGLMAAAETLPPPEPIPLVPPLPRAPAGDDRAPTAHFGPTAGAASAGGEPRGATEPGTGRPPTVVADRPPLLIDEDATDPSTLDDLDDAASGDARGRRGRRRRRHRGAGDGRRRRPRVRTILVVLLVLAALGVLGALAVRLAGDRVRGPATHEVADYVGRDVDEVTDELAATGYGWQLDIQATRRDGSEVDEILEQSPPAGSRLQEGDVLHLTRSTGEELVRVPADVVGKQFDDPAVARAFASATLLVTPIEAFDETQPPGVILRVDRAGRDVEQGTRITVTVSKGPEPRILLDYPGSGKTVEQVKAELETAGITVVVEQEASDEVPEKQIISTNPAAGAPVAKGGAVTVVASTGLPILVVPDLTDSTGREAEDALSAQGWVVTGIDGPSTSPVVATDPSAGAERRKGSKIRIITQSN